VGTAGAKGFRTALIGPYLKDTGEDESIEIKMLRIDKVTLMPTMMKTSSSLT
jgi:hypothetical protein